MECEDAKIDYDRLFEKVVTTSEDDFKKSGVDKSVFEEFRAVSYPVRTSACLSAPYSILSARSPYYYHYLSTMNCIGVAYRVKRYSQEALRRFCRRGSHEIADLARVWARLAGQGKKELAASQSSWHFGAFLNLFVSSHQSAAGRLNPP